MNRDQIRDSLVPDRCHRGPDAPGPQSGVRRHDRVMHANGYRSGCGTALGRCVTRSLAVIAVIPVWLAAWRINRRGSPLGAALMSYTVLPITLIAVDLHRYLVPWNTP